MHCVQLQPYLTANSQPFSLWEGLFLSSEIISSDGTYLNSVFPRLLSRESFLPIISLQWTQSPQTLVIPLIFYPENFWQKNLWKMYFWQGECIDWQPPIVSQYWDQPKGSPPMGWQHCHLANITRLIRDLLTSSELQRNLLEIFQYWHYSLVTDYKGPHSLYYQS